MRGVVRMLWLLGFLWALGGLAQGRASPVPQEVMGSQAAVDVVCKFEGGSLKLHAPLVDGLRVERPRLERYFVTRTEFGVEEVQFADLKKLVFVRPLKLDKDGYVKAILTPREGKERKVDVLVRKDGRALVLVSPGTDAPNFRLVDCLELTFLWPK